MISFLHPGLLDREAYPLLCPHTQVVVLDNQVGNSVLMAMNGVEGKDWCINGKNKFEAKILQGNKLIYPLRFNLSSKQFVYGKECDCRNLRKGLIVEVKENWRRRVFWDHNKGVNKSLIGSHEGLWNFSQTLWGWAQS